MKKILSVFVLAAMVLAFAGMVSATPVCSTFETTFVSGVITDATNGNALVPGADVTVTCNGVVKNAISDANGGYQVSYTTLECPLNSEVSVSASFNTLTGNNEEVIWHASDTTIGCLQMIVNVACADVPLVPEFGLIAGLTTVLGALGAFFLVRRK
jgi:hypothetical protein